MLILSLPVTCNALMRSLETTPPITEAQLKDIQAIVILGGGKNNDAPEYGGIDTINKATLERLRYGARLQQQTSKPILVTGGAPFGGRPEAYSMAESLKLDFHAQNIWVEDRSHDTAENAKYSAALLKAKGVQRIALVSQAWHLPRAKHLFEQQGLTVMLAATGYTSGEKDSIAQWLPNADALTKSTLALKEILGRPISK